jgi:stearoyl-CoA desaturase (delta-9 desaturase)
MASSSSDVKVPVAQAETFPDGTTDHVPLRKRTYDIRKPHITEQPITLANWYQHVNWLNTLFIIMIPMVGLISSYWISLQLKTAIFAVAYYFFAGLGISKLASS